jgi:multidrug efflux pump subunit AcrA (membrane-fusion protein)
MSPRVRPFVLYGGLLVAIALSGSFAYGAQSPAGAKTATSSRTVTVQTGAVSQTVSADGALAPAADITLDFGTSGTITEIDVAAGDTVTAGQVLAKLDPAKAQNALEIANLALSGAQTKLAQAQAGTSTTTGGSGGSASSGSSGSSTTQATVDADQVALDDAQQAAAINANGYQLAVDQAEADQAAADQQLASDQQACAADATSAACGRIAADQDAVRHADDAVANAQQAQASGLQKDQQTVHQAQAKLAADQAAVRAAQSAPASSSTSSTVDASAVATAKSGVLSAQDQVASAQKALDATTLVAPTSGTITVVNLEVGDTTSGSGSTSSSSTGSGGSGTGAAGGGAGGGGTGTGSTGTSSSSFGTLVDTSGFSVSVSVPEADATKVKAGQPATITVDALDSQAPLDGSVAKVSDTATTTNNVVSYATTVTIDNPPASLRSGMSASVSIAVQTKSNVVEVTTAAITTRAGTSYVNKLVDGKAVETAIQTGLQGDESTEITSGLAAGDQVVIETATVAATTGTNTSGGGTLTGGVTGVGGFPGGGGFGGGGARNNRVAN